MTTFSCLDPHGLYMSLATPPLHALAARLLAEEADAGEGLPAAFRACEKLGGTLTKVVGAAGFRSLLARALALAQLDVPALAGIHVLPNGTLTGATVGDQTPENEQQTNEASVLVVQLLGLLHAFIGESLTMQLVKDAWPEIPAPTTAPKKGPTP